MFGGSHHRRSAQIVLDLIKSLLLFCPPSKLSIILQPKYRGECINFSRQISNESPQIINLAKETLHILFTCWSLHFLNSFYLLGINFYTIFMNNETQELASRYTKSTF